MNRILLTMAALAIGMAALAQDVTATYVQNPSFEADDPATLSAVNNAADGLRGYSLPSPQGWTVTGSDVVKLLVTPDCYTDNNFGLVTTVADGSRAYYLRMGWSTGSSTVSQTLRSLPRGTYELKAMLRSAYANSATSSFRLFAGGESAGTSFDQGAQGCFATAAWKEQKVRFTVSAPQDVAVGLQVDWLSGGSCIMMDDFRLEKVSDEVVEPDEPTEQDVASPTEDVIDHTFVGEAEMKGGLLQMVANFAAWMKADFQEAQQPNNAGEACGCFRSNSTMQNNEDGVRSNADLGMLCAFLVKYGPGRVTLPAGVAWDDIRTMAMKSLVFTYSTHKANRLKTCSGGNYWGSTSTSDVQWESSLWAMSAAYSAFFLWDSLTDAQKGYVRTMLKAECNYELTRTIPTGYQGDTKAEENGWEACVLAATLGLFPDDDLAPRWFDRLRAFAINSYSHQGDARDHTVIDPDYDQKTVADYYAGQNLYSDYTLQNHNYFHTSYQNVVIQELGEAALALRLFQTQLHGTETWKTNALMHHNLDVEQQVLNWLALADGELAMPNGNDWSLFLYDQITSYSTLATFLGDADALMLENMAYKYIRARQQTTTDGAWLLRSDIGARRMGVEGHRVMMTWLMHELNSTAGVEPTEWEAFRQRHSKAKLFTSQNIVRASTRDRFTTFSWAPGISSYTGYIAANSADKNKIIVPFKQNNTGNFIGWYTVDDKSTDATPTLSGAYSLDGDAWTMNGRLSCNGGAIDNRFAIYSTPGNAVVYLDQADANADCTVSHERGGLMAISVDDLTRRARTLYYSDTHKQTDGTTLTRMPSTWVNIDNALGVVAHNDTQMAFGDQANNNSILTAKLYAAYSDESRSYRQGQNIGRRNFTWYSNVTAAQTRQLDSQLIDLRGKVPSGWNGIIVADPDSTRYLMLSHFTGSGNSATLRGIATTMGAPVFSRQTTISGGAATATFTTAQNRTVTNVLRFFVSGIDARAIQAGADTVTVQADEAGTLTIATPVGSQTVDLRQDEAVRAAIVDGVLVVEPTDPFVTPTGISDVARSGLSSDNDVYNLQGMRMTDGSGSLPNGVYISNGRKQVRR